MNLNKWGIEKLLEKYLVDTSIKSNTVNDNNNNTGNYKLNDKFYPLWTRWKILILLEYYYGRTDNPANWQFSFCSIINY